MSRQFEIWNLICILGRHEICIMRVILLIVVEKAIERELPIFSQCESDYECFVRKYFVVINTSQVTLAECVRTVELVDKFVYTNENKRTN